MRANRERKDNISIIGFMGAGKSTVARLVAVELGMECVDLDAVIEERCGKKISRIFKESGEGSFRDLEHVALEKMLREGGKVISCGGGVVLRGDNVEALRERSMVFYLCISHDVAGKRLADSSDRPLLEVEDRGERIGELMREREELYLDAAHQVLDADYPAPQEIAERIAETWRRSV